MDGYIYQGDNYHHCIDCGLVINFGDMVFRGKWGYRCYTCQYYFDTRNKTMPNIKITAEVDGKQVPLETVSTETFEAIKALEKPKEIPVASIGNYPGQPKERRLFLKVTSDLKRTFRIADPKIIAIDLTTGIVTKYWKKEQQFPLFFDGGSYENVKPL